MDDKLISVKRITNFDTSLVDDIAQIEKEALGEGALNRWSIPAFIRHGAVYVLECDGVICGVADVLRDWLDPQLAFINNFVVRKEERGKGLGFRFLIDLAQRLKADGIQRVQLTVGHDNKRAIGLYQKVGFQQIAELSDEYGPGVDRLLYELELEG